MQGGGGHVLGCREEEGMCGGAGRRRACVGVGVIGGVCRVEGGEVWHECHARRPQGRGHTCPELDQYHHRQCQRQSDILEGGARDIIECTPPLLPVTARLPATLSTPPAYLLLPACLLLPLPLQPACYCPPYLLVGVKARGSR